MDTQQKPERERAMRRRLTRPQNPELLSRVFAALRVYSGQREPQNDAERAIYKRLTSLEASPDAARRMVATLNAMPANTRRNLLREIAEPSFVPSETVPPTKLEVAFTRDTTDRVVANTLGTTLVDGRESPLGESPETMGEGPRPELVYTIRYNGLWCQEESTWDRFSGSDEIYLITTAVHIDPDGSNIVRTERHPIAGTDTWYEDVDSGEERVGPVGACWFNNADPVSLTVVVVEHDEGDPNAYRDEIDTLVKAIISAIVTYEPELAWLELLSGFITDAINWVFDTGDDPVETQTVVLPRALLELYASQWPAPHYGTRTDSGGIFGFSTTVPFTTNFMKHFITTHNGGGATYVAGFEVLRDPPVDRPIILL